jgi:hypothetical protein
MLKEKRHWQYTHFGSTLPGELLDSSDTTDTMRMLLFFILNALTADVLLAVFNACHREDYLKRPVQ